MSKPTITEFLEARIGEDEARAGSGWARLGDSRWETTNEGQDFLTPSAVLAECAAKRAIVEICTRHLFGELEVPKIKDSEWMRWGDPALFALAAVYVDHPDYDPEWAPRA